MLQKYKLKRPDRGQVYRYDMIKHEHETNNLIPEAKELNKKLYYNWKYRAGTDGLNVSCTFFCIFYIFTSAWPQF